MREVHTFFMQKQGGQILSSLKGTRIFPSEKQGGLRWQKVTK